ncbi:hypothetical protein H8E77_42370 [bacterium]|nr:hypothetical protein [bacterium]
MPANPTPEIWSMPIPVFTALVALIGSIIGSILTLVIGWRRIKVENKKYETEVKKLQIEVNRLQMEENRLKSESPLLDAEVKKLKAETENLLSEIKQTKLERLQVRVDEIRDILTFLERAVFDAPLEAEEPIAMFQAIQHTRISLQTSGATLLGDRDVAERFRNIRRTLLDTESEVLKRYPAISELITRYHLDSQEDWSRPRYNRPEIREVLGDGYWESVRLMMGIRRIINENLGEIKARLDELNNQIRELAPSDYLSSA